MSYTATDGTVFEDRAAYRKHEFETQYTFKEKSGERLLKAPGSIGGWVVDPCGRQCVYSCVRACVHAYVRACVRVCVHRSRLRVCVCA